MEFASRVRAAVAGSLGDWMEYQHLAQAKIVDLLDAQETVVVRDAEGDSSTIQRPDNRVEVMAEDGERVVAEAGWRSDACPGAARVGGCGGLGFSGEGKRPRG